MDINGMVRKLAESPDRVQWLLTQRLKHEAMPGIPENLDLIGSTVGATGPAAPRPIGDTAVLDMMTADADSLDAVDSGSVPNTKVVQNAKDFADGVEISGEPTRRERAAGAARDIMYRGQLAGESAGRKVKSGAQAAGAKGKDMAEAIRVYLKINPDLALASAMPILGAGVGSLMRRKPKKGKVKGARRTVEGAVAGSALMAGLIALSKLSRGVGADRQRTIDAGFGPANV